MAEIKRKKKSGRALVLALMAILLLAVTPTSSEATLSAETPDNLVALMSSGQESLITASPVGDDLIMMDSMDLVGKVALASIDYGGIAYANGIVLLSNPETVAQNARSCELATDQLSKKISSAKTETLAVSVAKHESMFFLVTRSTDRLKFV